jgi:hypothetical protein
VLEYESKDRKTKLELEEGKEERRKRGGSRTFDNKRYVEVIITRVTFQSGVEKCPNHLPQERSI